MTTLYRKPGDRFFDVLGNPLSGGSLNYFMAGTSTAQNTFSDAAGQIPNTNPVVLDGTGQLANPVFLGDTADYKEVVKDGGGAIVRTFDGIPRATTAAVSTTAIPIYNWSRLQVLDWTSSTAHDVGNQVANDSGKIYICVTAGISASSGGPTGTGSGISDGTVVWNFASSIEFTLDATAAGGAFEVDTTLADVNINLPSVGLIGSGIPISFKKLVAGNGLTLTPFGSDTIDGTTDFSFTEEQRAVTACALVTPDVTGWDLLSEFLPHGIIVPTVQEFLSGSAATYTPPAGITYIKVRMVGGGGGGGPSQGGTGGGVGGTTSFGTWTAIGGSGGAAASAGGLGGTGGTDGTGLKIARRKGGSGSWGAAGGTSAGSELGGIGGANPFGGAGPAPNGANPGIAGAPNTGAGGSGGGAVGNSFTGGSGGGAGEYVEFIMTAAQVGASLTYTVGAAGTAGAPGVGEAGGAGVAGCVIVEEFYN